MLIEIIAVVAIFTAIVAANSYMLDLLQKDAVATPKPKK
jgi:hypothetical protein